MSFTKWETKGTKSQKVYNDKKAYEEHLKTLNDAFKSKESPFEVRKTKSMGLGVYVKNNKGFGVKQLVLSFWSTQWKRH